MFASALAASGVTIGPGVQIGALSLVPEHVTLDGPGTYAGCRPDRSVPVPPRRPDASESQHRAGAVREWRSGVRQGRRFVRRTSSPAPF